MTVPLRVVYCHCAYANVVPKATKEYVLRQLSESDVPFDAVPDLCELSAKKDPCLAHLVGGGLDFKMGRSIKYRGDESRRRGGGQPHNRLLVALANGFGHEIETFGNPDFCRGGALTGLV